MTFSEALTLKQQIGNTITIEEKVYKVFVVPKSVKDFEKYLGGYLKSPFTDESAKLYSTNSEFTVFGLWQYMSTLVKVDLERRFI